MIWSEALTAWPCRRLRSRPDTKNVASDQCLRFLYMQQILDAKMGSIMDVKILGKVFVCVEVLRPSQPNGIMSSAVYWAGLVLKAVNQYCAHSFARN